MAEIMTNFTAADMLGNKVVAPKVVPVAPAAPVRPLKTKVAKVEEPVVEEVQVEEEVQEVALAVEPEDLPVDENHPVED